MQPDQRLDTTGVIGPYWSCEMVYSVGGTTNEMEPETSDSTSYPGHCEECFSESHNQLLVGISAKRNQREDATLLLLALL